MRPFPRLILVDGFAGSGKSTTAQRLWLQLAAAGRRSAWFHEHQADHPIFRYGEVEELLAIQPDRFEEQILANWTALARSANAAATCILEGSLFQITVGVLLAHNVRPARIARVLLDIERRVAGLDPALIHLYDRRTRDGLLRIRKHRGDYWLNGMTTIVGQSPYGRRHRVRDVDGLVKFYEAQRAIVDAALARMKMRRLAIEIGGGRWPEYERRAASFLGLGRPVRRAVPAAQLLRYAGRYAGRAPAGDLLITTDAASLYRQEPLLPAQRLLPIGGGRFCVESLPIDLQFTPAASAPARRIVVDDKLVGARRRCVLTRRREARPR